MDASQAQEVAEQLECPVELLGVLPELLVDFEELGSDADVAVQLLRRCGVGPGARVLDLACGKGGLAVPIAAELGCHVHGVDLMEPFIDSAQQHARREGVADACRFEVGDARRAIDEAQGAYDAVLYAALRLFESPQRAIAQLRRTVKPGGVIFIDDGFVADAAVAAQAPEHYEGYLDLASTRAAWQSAGDRIEVEHIYPRDDITHSSAHEAAQIRSRAHEVAKRHPELAPAIEAFVESQAEAYAFLSNAFASAAWAILRA